MSKANRIRLFNNWAKDYHPEITSSNDAFPFACYDHILDEVVRLAAVKPGMRILDLGIGTGNLAKRFLSFDCEIWGADFSSEMLAQVRERFPRMHLVNANMLEAWPDELNYPFDRVVSAYVFHELDLSTKIKLLQRIFTHHLANDGYVVIADVAFPFETTRLNAAQHWADQWDDEEYYWVADEAIDAAKQAGLYMEYRQLSKCGGVFVVSDRESIL